MSNPEMEERAALHALGLADEAESAALKAQAANDPAVAADIRAFENAAACLAYDAPEAVPPPHLKNAIMARLPARSAASKLIAFPTWVPYALAACLTALAIFQANQIFTLSRQVGAEHAEAVAQRNQAVALQKRNQMAEMRLASLEAKDPTYGSAKVMVAWDPTAHNGVISIQNLPAAPAGHDYQLWVLDPSANAPISAGLLKATPGSQGFATSPIGSKGPGFAISLEPAGGRPAPTSGAILFAVAPGE